MDLTAVVMGAGVGGGERGRGVVRVGMVLGWDGRKDEGNMEGGKGVCGGMFYKDRIRM